MAVSYSNWSVSKLKKEKEKIEKAITAKESRERKSVLAEIHAVAKKSGFELSELVGEPARNGAATQRKRGPGRPPGKRAPAKVKYKNPENSSERWTGRGRKPRWVVSHLESGGSMDDLAV